MKSITVLRKLAKNPFYQFTEEEKALLIEAEANEGQEVLQVQLKKKRVQNETAIVKASGKLVKHPTEAIKE